MGFKLILPKHSEIFKYDSRCQENIQISTLLQSSIPKDHNGDERVIAYGLGAMSNHERGYSITINELLDFLYFCKSFNDYQSGKDSRFEYITK